MTDSGGVDDAALADALRSLEGLAVGEYGLSLEEIFAGDIPVVGSEHETAQVRDSQDAVWRAGRLVGITVKEPFATPRKRKEEEPSQTGARRVWDLDPEVLRSEHADWWQYRLITNFLESEQQEGLFDWLPPPTAPETDQVAWFLATAHSERGLFGVLVKSARRYLCGKPELAVSLSSAELSTSVEGGASGWARRDVPEAKGAVKAVPTQVLFAGVTSASGAALVAAVPWLAPSMTPLIAGLLLVISAQGLDAFCRRTVPAPATGVVDT